ncbi:membrane protein insertase YidC [Brevibacillus choshinensis]|uniref:Membrane protein insertase YidC n=1 Tax=Brevibacillus choshinensis TaxID=54911 RepID=A0ABR5N8Y8_BRECH|nr:membrane protein insertase YidC [Brevibacillus choshinensis]KQL46907.1 preprotein translocase YidC [Brevibacillus choshinensis]MED4583489.1 membrane protein insertase YidC [Brevibacillus choshinensis]MED4751798.1 membrane protein insertase YidC [Brevibacillus choshinensis]MED4779961.1 membrane protein insertase YidC [Brevibacillus choshinensis]
MSRRTLSMLMLTLLVLILSGCNPQTAAPIGPDATGIWDKYLVYPLSWLIKESALILGNNYGLGILVATIIIRLIVLPLMVKQIKSSKKMQELQPEMQKIREKHKNDPQKAQQETMAIFQKNGVNPLAGCLPMLVQMPILIAFYHAIIRTSEIKSQTFLWLTLGDKDPYYILPVVAAATTYLQSKMMGQATQGNPQMKMMLVMMPLMILAIAVSLPSALSLYWVYGNLFTIVQTYFLYRDKGNKLTPKEGASK